MNNYFYFDGGKDSKNLRPLAFKIYANGKQIKKRIGEKMPEEFFIQAEQRVKKSYPEAKRINDKLQLIEENFLKLIEEVGLQNIGPIHIEEIITAAKNKVQYEALIHQKNSLHYWLLDYMSSNCKSEAAVQAYRYTAQSVELFEKYNKITITFDWLEKNVVTFRNKFIKFLQDDITIDGYKKKVNKAGSIINKQEKLNTVINYYNKVNRANIQRLKISQKDTRVAQKDIVALDKNEMTILYNLLFDGKLDIKENHRREVANFLLRGMTSMRYSEMKQLTLRHFEGETLTYIANKTGKIINVPLFPQAKRLAAYLGYEWKQWKNDNQKNALMQKETKVMREVCDRYLNYRELQTYDFDKKETTVYTLASAISSHSGRKSYASMIYSHTKDIFVTSKLLHHYSVEDTVRYLGLNQNNLRDKLVGLRIGGVMAIENNLSISNDNANYFTKEIGGDPVVILPYSNISLSLISVVMDLPNKKLVNEIMLDDKYKLISNGSHMSKDTILTNNAVIIDNATEKVYKKLQKGVYKLSRKGLS